MKNAILITATIAGFVATANAAAPAKNTPMTPEQRDMIIMMKAGGFIDKPIQTTIVRIYNTQDVVEKKMIEEVAVQMERGTMATPSPAAAHIKEVRASSFKQKMFGVIPSSSKVARIRVSHLR